MEAIILLCLLGLVIIAGITWFVIASRRGTRYQHIDQFVSRVPTDPIDRLLHPTNDPTNTDTGYRFLKIPMVSLIQVVMIMRLPIEELSTVKRRILGTFPGIKVEFD